MRVYSQRFISWSAFSSITFTCKIPAGFSSNFLSRAISKSSSRYFTNLHLEFILDSFIAITKIVITTITIMLITTIIEVTKVMYTANKATATIKVPISNLANVEISVIATTTTTNSRVGIATTKIVPIAKQKFPGITIM